MSRRERVQRSRPSHRVVLRRRRGAGEAKGRFVKDWPQWSRYQAKRLRDFLEEKYDSGYYVEIEPWPDGDPRTYTDAQRRAFSALSARGVQLEEASGS